MVTLLENPLRVGLRKERVPEPQILVIFGASGDLTQRKLVPAIYQMKRDRRLPPETTVVGVARRPWSHDYFREQMREGIEEFGGGIGSEELWQDFAQGLYYCPGDIDNPESYQKLKAFLAEIDEERRTRGGGRRTDQRKGTRLIFLGRDRGCGDGPAMGRAERRRKRARRR